MLKALWNSWQSTDVYMRSQNILLKLGLKVSSMEMLFIADVSLFFLLENWVI